MVLLLAQQAKAAREASKNKAGCRWSVVSTSPVRRFGMEMIYVLFLCLNSEWPWLILLPLILPLILCNGWMNSECLSKKLYDLYVNYDHQTLDSCTMWIYVVWWCRGQVCQVSHAPLGGIEVERVEANPSPESLGPRVDDDGIPWVFPLERMIQTEPWKPY